MLIPNMSDMSGPSPGIHGSNWEVTGIRFDWLTACKEVGAQLTGLEARGI